MNQLKLVSYPIIMIIYKVTNKINGKSYIGQTIRCLKNRKYHHIYDCSKGSKLTFHKAIRKYGQDNFEWIVIDKCDNLNQLDEMEFHYMMQYNTLIPNGYNMTSNTCGNLHHDFSGKNNPRYGDHRTYIELHGEKKANELRMKISKRMKESDYGIHVWKKNNPNYNPMNYEDHRNTLSKMRMGGNNPMAIYNYRFELPDGTVYETDCLRKFCRNTGFKRPILHNILHRSDYTPRDSFYKGWIAIKMLKENKIDSEKIEEN